MNNYKNSPMMATMTAIDLESQEILKYSVKSNSVLSSEITHESPQAAENLITSKFDTVSSEGVECGFTEEMKVFPRLSGPVGTWEVCNDSRVKLGPGMAEFGRREIALAEVEMPGLMILRDEFRKTGEKPLAGARISGSLHMTIQSAVLIETLQQLGAEVRWCSCNVFSTQDHAAAAIAVSGSAKVFAWKAESLSEYWWCMYQAMSWPPRPGGVNKISAESTTYHTGYAGPDLLIDDGGDAALIIHEGVKYEDIFLTKASLPDISQASNDDHRALLTLFANTIKLDPYKWHNVALNVIGLSEETTTGIRRLIQLTKQKKLLFPAINVNDCVTKSKFDNIYGCRHSVIDGIMRATDVMIGGKKVLILGFGDVGKGCAQAFKGAGASVYVAEIDPICALQAAMEGYSVVVIESVVDKVDIFVTCTGNKNVILVRHMEKMKNNAIIGNIGHFDNEIDMTGLYMADGIKKQNIKPQVDRFEFKDGHAVIILAEGRLLNLGCATGHPSFVMSCSFSNQTLAQLDLWQNRHTNKYGKDVYLLPKELDEKVARMHLAALGCELTKLTQEQADYMGINVNGPYKSSSYRY